MGPNIRTEILFYLEHKAGIAIRVLAQSIGYAYNTVHKEVAGMLKNGLLVERSGRGHILFLSDRTRKLLKTLPG